MNNEQYERQYSEFRDKSNADQRFRIEDHDKQVHLNEDTFSFSYDPQYLYHTAWASQKLAANRPCKHADFSSFLYFSTIVSAFIPVEFYDFRPAAINLDNFKSNRADLLCIDIPDNSLESVSCMHVIEHIGLGRYGDPISPTGDITAANELKRVLAVGGFLYIVLPVGGENRVYFNAHRVYTYHTVLSLFSGLTLKSTALLCASSGPLQVNADESVFNQQSYGCGCFEFQKVA
jgi:hypothetical protein